MACAGCGKKGHRGSNPGGSRKITVFGPGTDVKLRYIGGSKNLLYLDGPATRKEYVVGGRINLITADSRDLATGISWAPGLLEMTDAQGHKVFELHVPLKEEIEAEAKAKIMEAEAWKAAEALALPSEKPKRKVEPDGQSTISGD